MPLRIVRNDITKMNTEAIVNTANEQVMIGPGCDMAIYEAAGREKLLAERAKIGELAEGEACITPGFDLQAKYIIHAVSPLFKLGTDGEEEKLRNCYRNALKLAKENNISSIAFPLIATGAYGYPKEQGMRIAVDEIGAFLLTNPMLVYLVVFDENGTKLGKNLYPDLESYIDSKYVEDRLLDEYGAAPYCSRRNIDEYEADSKSCEAAALPSEYSQAPALPSQYSQAPVLPSASVEKKKLSFPQVAFPKGGKNKQSRSGERNVTPKSCVTPQAFPCAEYLEPCMAAEPDEVHGNAIAERMKHLSDTFPEYLLYLIDSKGMENAEVYKRAIVDKKVFSKIKNNPNYHPQKITALCLCIGAKLNLDESIDLLARAGYALSPCDKTDIIFSYFIEHEIYDMIEIDILLEEHGLPCVIS